MAQLNEKQAYQAMILYLQEIYRRTASEDIGALLGEMSLLPDGSAADPAAWLDWLQQVHHVLGVNFDPSETDLNLALTPAVRQRKVGT